MVARSQFSYQAFPFLLCENLHTFDVPLLNNVEHFTALTFSHDCVSSFEPLDLQTIKKFQFFVFVQGSEQVNFL
jgi:hypothetical protein